MNLKPELADFDFYILCHPDNLELLKNTIDGYGTKTFGDFHSPFGIDIHTDKNLPKFQTRWQFPKMDFVEFEPKDEEWCRPIKWGKEIVTDIPLFYKISKRYSSFNFHKNYIRLMEPNYIVTNLS
jgi:hypothetical protein